MRKRKIEIEKVHLLMYFKAEEIGPLPDNFEGKVMLLKPEMVRPALRSRENLIWRATGGFGCSALKIGRAVFATCLYDKERARWDRHDFAAEFLGDVSALPEKPEPVAQPVSTVNVIEWADGTISQVKAFDDNPLGNKRAEVIFRELALAHGAEAPDMESYLEDGHYENGNYEIFLVHSTV